jgi:hypothetical protein
VSKIEENFCNRVLTSAWTESGIFCKEGGSHIDWFSLKINLGTSPGDSGLHVQIWQEAGKKSSQQAARLKLELVSV